MTRRKNNDRQYGPNARDRKLWAEYVRDIRPLDPDSAPDPGQIPCETDDESRHKDPLKQTDKHSLKADPNSDIASSQKSGSKGQKTDRPQLDRRSDDKLRRGKLPIEARLDLHGHTREAARHALTRFLRESHAGGKRCVLVITGRGALGAARDGDEKDHIAPGVLRRSVPEWLAEPPLSDIVIRHYPARAKDGGDGALYILLKRRRG